MENPLHWAVLTFGADWLLRLGLSIRVIMRRRPVGVSLAWLTLLMLIPFAGALLYLFLGELRLGRKRAERAVGLHGSYRNWITGLAARYAGSVPRDGDGPELARLVRAAAEIPPLSGNRLELIDNYREIFLLLINDIDRAQSTCDLEFYIWHPGGMADEVVDALVRAAGRGVECRVLLDAVGSGVFLKSPQAAQLRESRVDLRAALPVSTLRMLFVRADLRLHRKIAVFDGQIAYTGSQNLVDPRYFKQGAGVGEWVDAMVRIQGPAVEALLATFIEDWELESGDGLVQPRSRLPVLPPHGAASIQVLPSGPDLNQSAMTMVLLTALYSARKTLVLTTPYFVPDESLLLALISAALRGVDVTLVVPAKNDSKLVDLASRAFQGDLATAGVRVMLFEGGLLHTKSITIDDQISLFGSLNLDPRSLQLNFEITLAVYDAAFTARLHDLQQGYIRQSQRLDVHAWKSRPFPVRLAENAARLAGPLL